MTSYADFDTVEIDYHPEALFAFTRGHNAIGLPELMVFGPREPSLRIVTQISKEMVDDGRTFKSHECYTMPSGEDIVFLEEAEVERGELGEHDPELEGVLKSTRRVFILPDGVEPKDMGAYLNHLHRGLYRMFGR
jgi:hypothetical protein